MSDLESHRESLQAWLAGVSSADKVKITSMNPLTGGSIQENWRIECDFKGGSYPGPQRFVLRSDAPSSIAASLSRREEFNVLLAANAVGVDVPEPLWLCEDTAVTGRPFYIMQLIEGIALGPKVVKDQSLGGDREALGRKLGGELAKIHSIHPPVAELDFLDVPDNHPAINTITLLRRHLDEINEVRPVLEWGLRWAELNIPDTPDITLVHQDFRTGNYLVDSDGLKGILDWEFATWGDPMSDIGWFCAECWRFSHPELEAGGVSSRKAFYEGYRAGPGARINESAVFFWEVIAHIRWAVIALQQAHRHLSGTQRSLELALTGRLLPDLELPILNMTSPGNWSTM
ncbi:MAG: phosphotransferase family protein [Proteobacteria bacterium]|nr:phosphotransferase family protein [Pseudomonadota bacterium]